MNWNERDRTELNQRRADGSISEFDYELQLALLDLESEGFIVRSDQDKYVSDTAFKYNPNGA